MTWALAASALIATATWLLVPPWRHERADRLSSTGSSTTPLYSRAWSRFGQLRWRIGPAARKRQAQQRMAVIQALGVLAADLEAGQPPNPALISAGGAPSMWPHAAGAARLGDDVVAGLILDSDDGSGVLRQLAACWQVATESGSGLALAVARLAASARAAEDVRVQLAAELAGPRATARTLAFLPLVGVAFGVMMGADPLQWLIGSTLGWGCLVVGGCLTILGGWWTGRIAARVEAML